jgi:hypothetical protein
MDRDRKFNKRKKLQYADRKKALQQIYEDLCSEYNEQVIPANICELFIEVLEALPKGDLKDLNIGSLFKSALKEALNEDFNPIETKKTYI